MAKDTVTLALNGEIPLRQYVAGMQRFLGLIEGLTNELVNRASFEWVIADLVGGSAITTARAEPQAHEDIERIERIARAYVGVGRSLAQGQPILHSDKVIREAEAILGLLDGHVTSIRFENAEEDVTIVGAGAARLPRPNYISAYGAIEGVVQTLTSRRGLRFTLFDSLLDQAVSCYLEDGQEELMRDVWGRRAIVEGWVSRDPISSRPVTIRHIESIIPTPNAPAGSYEKAAGIWPRKPGDLSPEERIRQLRDAW